MKRIKKRISRIAAMLLVLAMLVTSVPQYALTASAAETAEDAAVAEEHVEAEAATEAETEVRAADTSVTEEENKTAADVEEKEGADTVREVEEKTEADAAETTVTVTETETEKVSESETGTETEAVTETVTELESEQETVCSEAEESESDDVLAEGKSGEDNGYTATFNYPENAEVHVYDKESDKYILLENGNKEVWIANESDELRFCVKPSDNTKGVFVEYTEIATGETKSWGYSDYDKDEFTYYYDIWNHDDSDNYYGDISVNISVVDICTITVKAKHDAIKTVWYNTGCPYDSPDRKLEFKSAEDSAEEGTERTAEIKMIPGYSLDIGVDKGCEFGTVTVVVNGTEYTGSYTPTGDTTITFDIKPEEFIFDVEKDVEFSVYEEKYNEETGDKVWEEITLSENNSISYYDRKNLQVKVTPEEGKKYQAKATTFTIEEYTDSLEAVVDEETGAWTYKVEAGRYANFTLRCYDTVPVTFIGEVPDDCELEIVRIEYERGYNEEYEYEYVDYNNWDSWDVEENKTMADKDGEIFFAILYDERSYKLDYVSATDVASGSLEIYKQCDDDDWIVYKLVPTAETTVTIKVSALDKYTVTVTKGENIKNYSAKSDGKSLDSSNGTFKEIKENSTFTINNMESIHDGEEPVYIRKVEYETDDGKLSSGQVWVKIEPKNDKGNFTGERKVSYMIREGGKDLSKAKVTFSPDKAVYTGSPLEPECSVDGKSIKNNEKFHVRYLSNVNKGKATVIITSADEYVGSKTATFTITAFGIK